MAKEPELQFDWDEHNERHLKAHGVSPEEFEEVFLNDPEHVGIEEVNGEERTYAVGPTNGWRFLYLVYTFRGTIIRPVTAWNAPKQLEERWLRSRSFLE